VRAGAGLRGLTPLLLLVVVFAVGFYLGYQEGLEGASTITVTLQPEGIPSPKLQPLFNREYYEKLLELLDKANRSVYVIMYVAKYDLNEVRDPVNVVLERLSQLNSRGVEVRVVVDDETYRSYSETVEYLKSSGIGVRLDPSSGTTTHAKVVIVDGWVVLVGSHNWTESALTRNNEVSVIIYSEEVAREFVEYFENLWSRGRQV